LENVSIMKYALLALAVAGLFVVAPAASADCPGCAAPRAHATAYAGDYGSYGAATYAQPISYGYSTYSTAPARCYGVYTYNPYSHSSSYDAGYGYAGYATPTSYGYGGGCGGGCGCDPCGGGLFGRGGFLGTGLFR
jgi:hypothetical protein